MGNSPAKFSGCFTGAGEARRERDLAILLSDPLDEDLGHSFVYVPRDVSRLTSSKVHSDESTIFRTISGASVSANTSTLSTASVDLYSFNSVDKSSTFESSTSFSSIPLQPIPRNLMNSMERFPGSGPLERGFLSGPIERGFLSGPLDRGLFSGPIERSFSHGGGYAFRHGLRKPSLIRVVRSAISKTIRRGQKSIVTPIKAVKEADWIHGVEKQNENLAVKSLNFSKDGSLEGKNLEWAQGKAGEDRVHVVVSEEHGWVFVGIYDGFNGPDAPDYLLSNLYDAVHKELEGLLWDDDDDKVKSMAVSVSSSVYDRDGGFLKNQAEVEPEKYSRSKYKSPAKKWEENQRRWKCEWDRERLELDRRLKEEANGSGRDGNHSEVLKALSQALKNTEEAYLESADKVFEENPELALMGSCVLVMLMKGEDVYVMNVGDSRAVLAQKAEPDYRLGKSGQDLERIKEETLYDLQNSEFDQPYTVGLTAVQLTMDHSTNVEEEVQRIKDEHPDDPCAVVNERVKGSLKVTRAFGAGFLKQPKWNNALLEMFRIDYKGNAPYITCLPYLYHHRLGPKNGFLILSSDGLYQYFTNEEAVSEVELFMALQPEGDPAQHLVEEVLFRAAKKAGIDFHELLEIPQGDRRKYHDDVSIIVISLEGMIWRSCV